jgi:hypothetical protein
MTAHNMFIGAANYEVGVGGRRPSSPGLCDERSSCERALEFPVYVPLRLVIGEMGATCREDPCDLVRKPIGRLADVVESEAADASWPFVVR